MYKQIIKKLSGLLIVLVLTDSVALADATWTGTGETNLWTDAGNWNAPVPTGLQIATFDSVPTKIIDTSGVTLPKLVFDGAAGSYTLGASSGVTSLNNAGSMVIAATIQGSNLTQTITGTLTMPGSYSITNSSTDATNVFNITGPVIISGALALGGVNTGSNTISGNISGAGSISVDTRGDQLNSNWILSGNNSYTGNTTIGSHTLTITGNNIAMTGNISVASTGLLNIGNSAALGTGTLVLGNGGVFDNVTGGAMTLAGNNDISIGSGFTYKGSSNLNLGTGNVTLTGAGAAMTVTANTLVIGGNVTGGGASNRILAKNGAGTLILTGSVTNSNQVAVNAGTLLITGTASGMAAITISANAALGGAGGNIGTNNANVTVSAGAKLDVSGNTGNYGRLTFGLGTGVLNLSNALAGDSKAIVLSFDSLGNYDSIWLNSGSFNITAGSLEPGDLALSFGNNVGTGTYTILGGADLSGVLGTNLSGSIGTIDYTLGYGADDTSLVLNVINTIPEPSTWTLMGVGAALLVWVGYRKRKANV